MAKSSSLRDALRVRPGAPVDLDALDARATPLAPGGKKKSTAGMAADGERLAALQEALYAAGDRRVLVVLQGMDTSGKGGVIDHVIGLVNPQGVHIHSFKKPTPPELRRHFLWRVRRALPGPGMLGIFDRSHYEDVLVVRVHDLVPRSEWSKRYALINAFEREVFASGTRIVKVMTHISKDEQKARLRRRLERPDKHYKYNPGDIDERLRWDDYMAAYQAVLDKTSTSGAPWYVVPANKKWYARYAVQQLLLDALAEMNPTWPEMDFDVEQELERLDAS
jgi:PPK2 family polyphosphate:nucleotide phosphotransferase